MITREKTYLWKFFGLSNQRSLMCINLDTFGLSKNLWKGGGVTGDMHFLISTISLPYFSKYADSNELFPLFIGPVSKVFLLHIKHNVINKNHFLFILHMTDHMQALILSSCLIILCQNALPSLVLQRRMGGDINV